MSVSAGHREVGIAYLAVFSVEWETELPVSRLPKKLDECLFDDVVLRVRDVTRDAPEAVLERRTVRVSGYTTWDGRLLACRLGVKSESPRAGYVS